MNNSKHSVPIYSADIIFSKRSIKNKSNILEKIKMSEEIIKGFSIEDIIKRNQDKLSKKLSKIKKIGVNEYLQIEEIELLMQHGYGIND